MDCKSLALGLIGLLVVMLSPAVALEWRLEAGQLQLGPLQIERIELDRTAATARIGPLHLADGTALGTLDLRCTSDVSEGAEQADCRRARLVWQLSDGAALEFELQLDSRRLVLEGAAMRLRLERAELPEAWRVDASLPSLELLPALLSDALGLSSLAGELRLQGEIGPQAQLLRVELRDGALDTPDGRYAAGELGLGLDLRRSGEAIEIDAEWSAGEALLGPAYLPAPAQPVHISLRGRSDPDCLIHFQNLTLEQADMISVRARGNFDPCRGLEQVAGELVLERIDLAAAWTLGLGSLAGAAGWAGLAPSGVIRGSLELLAGQPVAASLKLADAALLDQQERVRIDGLEIALDWTDSGRESQVRLDWSGAAIHRVPLGPISLVLLGRDDVLRLQQPLAVPILDGRLLVDALEWRDWRLPQRDLSLSAQLEPIGLAALTRSLGWTEFGGQLSGRIPGLRVVGGVIELEGGLELALFDGRAQVSGLSIERPFGALPALAADIEFEALDLALLTGAFEIGSMRGRVSGHLRELRLLDWQPVRFDAWFETLDTGRDRWISQKAVDSLSTLGGGGGAALSGTLLQIFEDFPYRRIGLGCRLERNVCEMRGLERVDGGGYMIIEGRPLPVLNVVGHRSRVDWPQLVAQLRALVES